MLLASLTKPFPPLCSVHIHPWPPVLAGTFVIMTDGPRTISELSAPIADLLHSHYAIITHVHQLVVNLDGRKMLRPQRPNHRTKFFAGRSSQNHCHCTWTYAMNSVWLILAPSVARYPYYKCCFVPKNKMLYEHKITERGTLLNWPCSWWQTD